MEYERYFWECMPFEEMQEDHRSIGSVFKDYYIYVALSPQFNSKSPVGEKIVESLRILDKTVKKDILIRYPHTGSEDVFKEDIIKAIQRKDITSGPVFALILNKSLAGFDLEKDPFAVLDISEQFMNENGFQETEFSKHLEEFGALLNRNEDVFKFFKEDSTVADDALSAIELKPGLFGIRVDLKKLYKILTKDKSNEPSQT